MTIAAASGRLVEAHGRTVGSSAVVRFRDLSGDRLARAEIEARYGLLLAEVEAMRAMLAAAPMPVWIRDARGRLAWVNAAYAAAVEANDPAGAITRGLELLDSPSRQLIQMAHAADPTFVKRLPAIVAGTRRIFDVADITAKNGSAGIAVDVTAIETAEAALRREVDFNARTLDQLATAVAIFGSDKRLRSYNAAYRALFRSRRRLPRSTARTRVPCSIACAPAAGFPSRPTSAPGAPTSSPPTARWRRASNGGTCPTGRRSASLPTPIRRAA